MLDVLVPVLETLKTEAAPPRSHRAHPRYGQRIAGANRTDAGHQGPGLVSSVRAALGISNPGQNLVV